VVMVLGEVLGELEHVRYDKTILVGSGHSSAVRLGSEPGSWSPTVEASLGEASMPGRAMDGQWI
jgi:hypothetical protein